MATLEGRLLFLNNNYNGLNGNNNLDNNGRFVGIGKLWLGHILLFFFVRKETRKPTANPVVPYQMLHKPTPEQ
ncbi:MAG: hypothetical protein Q8R53_06175 [Nanoarchaeota archaeon]|nr:hypothetical protein [Nanoarchaeota archaeon]